MTLPPKQSPACTTPGCPACAWSEACHVAREILRRSNVPAPADPYDTIREARQALAVIEKELEQARAASEVCPCCLIPATPDNPLSKIPFIDRPVCARCQVIWYDEAETDPAGRRGSKGGRIPVAPAFFLGTHEPSWLRNAGVPLFVSRRRLARLRRMPEASYSWALDSGGFTELSLYGDWQTSERQYVDEVRRFRDEIGNLAWASSQDWMCEPFVLSKTRKSVEQHQALTVENYLTLRMLSADLPFIPVLQGWQPDDYLRHVEQYARAGVNLEELPLVGIGSVCRRQHTFSVEQLIYRLSSDGIKLHGFGFKSKGLVRCSDCLASADSLAWSFQARRSEPLDGCRHKSCANCLIYAKQWRSRLLSRLGRLGGRQLAFNWEAAC